MHFSFQEHCKWVSFYWKSKTLCSKCQSYSFFAATVRIRLMIRKFQPSYHRESRIQIHPISSQPHQTAPAPHKTLKEHLAPAQQSHPSYPPCHSQNWKSQTVFSSTSCCKHHPPCSPDNQKDKERFASLQQESASLSSRLQVIIRQGGRKERKGTGLSPREQGSSENWQATEQCLADLVPELQRFYPTH